MIFRRKFHTMQNANLFPKCSLERTGDAVHIIQEFSAIRKCCFIFIFFVPFANRSKQRASNGGNSSTDRNTTERRPYFCIALLGNHYSKGYVPKYFFPEHEGKWQYLNSWNLLIRSCFKLNSPVHSLCSQKLNFLT